MSPGLTLPSVEVRTDRMTLRTMREGDRSAFVQYHDSSREHLRPWSPLLPEGVTADLLFTKQLERSERGMREGTGLRLAGFDASAGVLIGLFNLNNIARGVFECADAGWQVGAGHVGQDLATEGVWALLDVAFARSPRGLALHRVQANVIPTNAASLRVADKCGFRREGFALRMLHINGAWQDHVMHGKLAEEHEFRYVK